MDSLNIIETTSSFVLTETDQAVHLTSAAQQGPPGPQGPSGYGVTYTHDQPTASYSWIINHNMNRYPSVTVVDSTGRTVEGEVRYISNNTIGIQFQAPFSGEAYLN